MKSTEEIRKMASLMKKAAGELKQHKPMVKKASKELDPKHVLNFITFFGAGPLF